MEIGARSWAMALGTAVRDTETVTRYAPATAAREPSAARGRRWRRMWRRFIEAESPATLKAARLERLLALLEDARAQLDVGWVQGSWWSIRTTAGERRVTDGFAAATTPPEVISGACLVGALIRAGTRQTPGAHSEVATAVDVVYDALWESSDPDGGLPAVAAPRVRLARVQTLTRWNDRPERTHLEVLRVVDRAIARTVQGIVTLPGPTLPGPTLPGPTLPGPTLPGPARHQAVVGGR